MSYTAFIGCWNEGEPDWTIFRADGLSWEQAKEKIKSSLDNFADDDCEHCRDDAAEGIKELSVMEPGAFECHVEGDEYLIIPSGSTA